MTRDEVLAAFDRIRVWQQGDWRAVHKPLLVLLALGRLLRGEAPLVEFAGVEDQLGKLLEEFGPSGSEKTRHNPFWHRRTDGVWQLAGPAEITSRPAGATPTLTELRRGRVAGGFAEPVRLALARDPALVAEIARRILNAHFPESIRQDVADAVGLCLDAESAATLAHRRRTNSAGVSIGYLSRRASRSPSPVTRTSALAAASVARIGASSGSRVTSTDIVPSSTTSARM